MFDWRQKTQNCSLSLYGHLLPWHVSESDCQVYLHCNVLGLSSEGPDCFCTHQNSPQGNWDLLAPKENPEVEGKYLFQKNMASTTLPHNVSELSVDLIVPWSHRLTSRCNLRGNDPCFAAQVFCRNLESSSMFLEFESEPWQKIQKVLELLNIVRSCCKTMENLICLKKLSKLN